MQESTHTQESVTRRVCEIPSDFHSGGNQSVYILLRASGYLKHPHLLTRDSIGRYLREHPERIATWQQYSEDKRASRGWYFTRDASDVEVGYFQARRGFRDVHQYASCEEACTEFILKEMADVAQGSTRFFSWVAGALRFVRLT